MNSNAIGSRGPLPPGSVIGVLGGGQLGRMFALAAARLGYRCHIFCPDPDAPAKQVTDRATTAEFDDEAALAAFAAAVDVVTYEFENVPAAAAAFVDRRVALRPSPNVLAICQDRIREKAFLDSIGVPTACWRPASDSLALSQAIADVGGRAVLKSARYGYDGKGQVAISLGTDLVQAWAVMHGDSGSGVGLVEAWIDFALEMSVIVARGLDGAMASYVPVENVHEQHILKRTIAPASIAPELLRQAEEIGRTIAEAVDLIGVLAVEMFVTREGALLVNELAPRPHNSGHWTIDACVTSQFEQCVRAVTGLPLGSPRRHSDAIMDNLLGDEIDGWLTVLAAPEAKLHLYGKAEARPGRKMGHVTRLCPLSPV